MPRHQPTQLEAMRLQSEYDPKALFIYKVENDGRRVFVIGRCLMIPFLLLLGAGGIAAAKSWLPALWNIVWKLLFQ
jgi:hypothetical protein